MSQKLIVIELPDGETVYVGAARLAETFRDEGWYAMERSSFFEVLPEGRRPLVLTDVISEHDDQFRYFRGNLVDVQSGEAVTAQPFSWDVRWLL